MVMLPPTSLPSSQSSPVGSVTYTFPNELPFRANTTGSKRRPWPYDLYLENVRCLLEPDQDGNLVSQDSKTLDETAPIDYTYSSANPYKERTSEFQKLFGGFGQSVCPDDKPRRYSYGEKVDMSVDGLWMKGPAFERHVETISTGAREVRQFVTALTTNNVVALFAICEQGVWIYNALTDTWDESLTRLTNPTLGEGIYCNQAVRFHHRGTNPTTGGHDALYLATNEDYLWRYRQLDTADGTSWKWERSASAAGPPADVSATILQPSQARYIERVGDELWVAGDYWVSKCEDNPFDRDKWSGAIAVGDRHARTTWLRQVNDTLYTFKEDGIYTVTAAGEDQELFPTLRGKNDRRNGKNASVWLDRIWFTYGNQTFTLNATGQLKADGLEQMLENTSPVRGRWIDGAGHNTWFFYELYHDEENQHSFLVKHGSWIEEPSSEPTPGVAQFAEAHHGALYDWPGKRATSMDIISDIDINGNDRLYVGFEDGTCTWTRLPQHSPNPATDRYCEFTNEPSYVYLPQHHSQFRADNKLWQAITVFGPHIREDAWATIEYRTDVAFSTADWKLVDEDDPRYTIIGQRHAFTDEEVLHPVYGRTLDLRIKLDKYPPPAEGAPPDTKYSEWNDTPILEGVAVHEAIRPAFSREFTFSIKLGSFLPKRDGTVDRRRSELVQQNLLQICAKIGPVEVLLPTGAIERMTIINYEDRMVSRQKYRDFIWLLKIRAIQLRTITPGAYVSDPPLVAGYTYGTLEQFTYGQLEQMI